MIAAGAIRIPHLSGGNAGRLAALATSVALHALVAGLLARSDAPVPPSGEEATEAIFAVEMVPALVAAPGDSAALPPSPTQTEPPLQDPAMRETPTEEVISGEQGPRPAPVRTSSDVEDRAVEALKPSDTETPPSVVHETEPAPAVQRTVEPPNIVGRPTHAGAAAVNRRNDRPPKRSRGDEPAHDRWVPSEAAGRSVDRGAKRGSEVASADARASGARTNDLLAAYLASVRASIVTRRRPRNSGEPGRVVVRFDVDRAGGLSAISIVDDGARFDLREEALRLVRRASPVSPIPLAIARDRLPMTVALKFE
jgi:periplasmic protein TonB